MIITTPRMISMDVSLNFPAAFPIFCGMEVLMVVFMKLWVVLEPFLRYLYQNVSELYEPETI